MKSTSSSRMVISLSSEVVSTDSHAAYRLLVGGSGVEVVVRRSRSGGFGFPPGDGDGGDVGLAWGWRAGDAHGRARGRPWLLTRRHGLVPSHAMTFWAALRYSGRTAIGLLPKDQPTLTPWAMWSRSAFGSSSQSCSALRCCRSAGASSAETPC